MKFEIVVVTEHYPSANLSIYVRQEKRFTDIKIAQEYYNNTRDSDCEYHATTAHLSIIES